MSIDEIDIYFSLQSKILKILYTVTIKMLYYHMKYLSFTPTAIHCHWISFNNPYIMILIINNHSVFTLTNT